MKTKIIALLCLFVLGAPAVSSPQEQIFTAGVELVNWREYSNGSRLLSESGPRLTIRFDRSRPLPGNNNLAYASHIAGYAGNINYNGQTQPSGGSIFVASTSQYLGLKGEWLILQALAEARQTQVLAGFGFDTWQRAIQSSTTALGDPVSSTTESFVIGYTRLGLQLEHQASHWRSETRLGLKYPFWTREKIDIASDALQPAGRPSLFISTRITPATQADLVLDLYYDSFRFDPSNTINSTIGPVHQPRSELDVVGILIGMPF